MLSLPPVIPHDVRLPTCSDLLSKTSDTYWQDLWSHQYHRPLPDPNDPSHFGGNDGPNAQHNNNNNANRRSTSNPHSSYRSSLAALRADEANIEQRKQNVRRFGATWLRPPGVAKTYQAQMDEEAERAEQAELARREALMSELAAAERSQVQLGADGAGEEVMEERDLDADVPDADADGEQDVTFNEESLLEGSDLIREQEEEDLLSQQMIRLEEAELEGRLQDERDLGLERDLDEDVPEAGSYEHTDTEEELESSDNEMPRTASRRPDYPQRFIGSRTSIGSEVELESSSFINDSPVLARGPGRGNAWRNRIARAGRRHGS